MYSNLITPNTIQVILLPQNFLTTPDIISNSPSTRLNIFQKDRPGLTKKTSLLTTYH